MIDEELNWFRNKTAETLGVGLDCKELSYGFDFSSDDNQPGECVLIMGLNPAGDSSDALREKTNNKRTFFYSLENKVEKKFEYCSQNYFKQIYEFINDITDNDAKWPWCNKNRKKLLDEINTYEDLRPYKDIILRQYDSCASKTTTIYIGEMFYYHETNSKVITNKLKQSPVYLKNYYIENLRKHIEILKNSNKTIRFVIINNATVSNVMKSTLDTTMDILDNIPVFYSGMLSGKMAMDLTSRTRLKKEIVGYFNFKKLGCNI